MKAPTAKEVEALELRLVALGIDPFRPVDELELGLTVKMLTSELDALKSEITTLRSELADTRERAKYKGVWSEGEPYLSGQLVTDKGSLWHCQRDAPSGRPGTCNDWRLMAKYTRVDRTRVPTNDDRQGE